MNKFKTVDDVLEKQSELLRDVLDSGGDCIIRMTNIMMWARDEINKITNE